MYKNAYIKQTSCRLNCKLSNKLTEESPTWTRLTLGLEKQSNIAKNQTKMNIKKKKIRVTVDVIGVNVWTDMIKCTQQRDFKWALWEISSMTPCLNPRLSTEQAWGILKRSVWGEKFNRDNTKRKHVDNNISCLNTKTHLKKENRLSNNFNGG